MKTGVVVLNWNGWEDTVQCLGSLFGSKGVPFQVVVCDNGSEDDSLDWIKRWAEGRLETHESSAGPLREVFPRPIPKPIPYVEYDRAMVEQDACRTADVDTKLILIRGETNLGYGGGNNIGIRYLLRDSSIRFVWILNNDTVVRSDALKQMVDRLSSDERGGICGSTILYHSAPEIVQACGGFRYNKWLGTSRQLGQFRPLQSVRKEDPEEFEKKLDGVQGASVLASRRFLERVGLLAEEYFLYFEEQDWAVRARRAGFNILYAPGSVVYHKEGASTGGASRAERSKSVLSDYYSIRSRLLFTRRYYPYALPITHLALIGTLFNRVWRGQMERVGMVLRLLRQSLRDELRHDRWPEHVG